MATPKEVAQAVVNSHADLKAAVGERLYTGSLEQIGQPILDDPLLRNAFLSVLYNKFISSEVISGLFHSPLEPLKGREVGRFGQTMERMIFNPAKAMSYFDTSDNILTSAPPDVKVEYLRVNRQDKYAVSIPYAVLAQAFSSEDKFGEFLSAAQNSLINGDTIDEFNLMKKIVVAALNDGFIGYDTVDSTETGFSKQLINMGKNFKFPSSAYNGYTAKYGSSSDSLTTWCNPDEIVILVRADAMTNVQVDVLAAAYHLDEVKLSKNIIEVDNFDTDGMIRAVVMDRSFMQVHDSLTEMGEFQRVDDLSTKTYWHHWQIMTFSLMANVHAYTEAGFTPTPTSNA